MIFTGLPNPTHPGTRLRDESATSSSMQPAKTYHKAKFILVTECDASFHVRSLVKMHYRDRRSFALAAPRP